MITSKLSLTFFFLRPIPDITKTSMYLCAYKNMLRTASGKRC